MAPRFTDDLAALLATEGTIVPDGFGDTIMSAYNDDLAEAVAEANGASNTIIGERDARIRELMAQAAISSIPADDAESLNEPDASADEDADFDDFFGDSPDEDNK